jgi:hypothetical protein
MRAAFAALFRPTRSRRTPAKDHFFKNGPARMRIGANMLFQHENDAAAPGDISKFS